MRWQPRHLFPFGLEIIRISNLIRTIGLNVLFFLLKAFQEGRNQTVDNIDFPPPMQGRGSSYLSFGFDD